MRVLHIDTMPFWRGGERQAYYLAKGLAERNCEVGFACQPGSALEPKLLNSGLRVHPTVFRFEADFTAAWRLAGLVRRYNYQVLHMHDSHAHWLGGCAARIAGSPLRVVSRRVDFSIHRHGFGLSIIKYRYFADTFVAVSEAVRSALVRDGVPPHMIHVVHSGVEIPPRAQRNRGALEKLLGTNGSSKIVGSVGSLVGHKGHRYLVEAAAEIVHLRPNVRFVIFGEGKLRRELESLIERRGLADKFLLPGFTAGVSTLLTAFDIFVMPSVMEGLGTSILDAMAAGVPVVGTRAGGIPEVVKDRRTGLLAAPRDPDSLAMALKNLLDNRELGRKLAARAKQEVSDRFTRELMVEKTLAVYKEELAKRT